MQSKSLEKHPSSDCVESVFILDEKIARSMAATKRQNVKCILHRLTSPPLSTRSLHPTPFYGGGVAVEAISLTYIRTGIPEGCSD